MSENKSAWDKEWIKFLSRLFSIVGIPVLAYIGALVNDKAGTIVKQQAELIKQNENHETRINVNTKSITDILKADKLFVAKQDATVNSLKANSIVGTEFWVDYDKEKQRILNEQSYTSP